MTSQGVTATQDKRTPVGCDPTGAEQKLHKKGNPMSDLILTQNLAAAWQSEAEAAMSDLQHAANAPAIFKPEFVAARQSAYTVAVQMAAYWNHQSVTR